MTDIQLRYPKELLKEWKTGDLANTWYRQFPRLFREEDWQIVANQHGQGAHFGEWWTAIYYWVQGYEVLIEKYCFEKAHPNSSQTLRDILKDCSIIFDRKAKGFDCQPPDLFVYKDKKDFFFVEVKRDRDKIRPVQERYFKGIERRVDCNVVVVSLKAYS